MKAAQRVTIQDISRRAGVSPSTVSRVLTGSAPVSEDKRRAVEEAISFLNYRPSLLARGLRTNRTLTLGLLVNDILNPFYGMIARGIEEEALLCGYSLILCNTNEDPERELHYLRALQSQQVDGIILGPTSENTDFVRDLSQAIPVIQVDRYDPDADLGAVVVDNEDAAYQATRHLIDKGHRHIGVVTWQRRISTMAQRFTGYQRALEEAGIQLDPTHIVEIPRLSSEITAEVTEQFLRGHSAPTAIFALNNQLGLGVIGAIRNIGLKIPDDIALVIFDDLLVFSLLIPSISAVRQPAFEIGKQAIQSLLRQISEPEDFVPETVVLPTEMIIREST